MDGEVTLRCWNASSQVLVVQWFHGEPGAIPMLFSSDGKLPSDSRLSLAGNSSLHISGLRREDEGHYLCREILAETNHTHRIQLLMAGVAGCSDSWPDSATKWDFNPLGSAQEPFTEVNSSQSSFVLHNIMPNYQGNYSCLARNLLSQRQKSVVRELLIYCTYAEKYGQDSPPSSPRCQAETSVENSQEIQLSCSWPGGYPPPTLQWINPEGLAMDSNTTTHLANATVVSLQGSRRLWGKDFVCRGNHIANEKRNQNCTLRLDPLNVAGIVGSVVVLLLLGVLVFSGILLYAGPQVCLKANVLRNRDAGDILELMDSDEDDLYLEATSEPTSHQMEGIGNRCEDKNEMAFSELEEEASLDRKPCGPAEELGEQEEMSQLVLDPTFPA
ncbi:hypothetical protein Chor_013083 [Crotalus horridus]